MSFLIVPIDGEPGAVAGRLALAGIQSIVRFTAPTHAAARLRAQSPEQAQERVRAALGDRFIVGQPRAEREPAEGQSHPPHSCAGQMPGSPD